MNEEYLKKIIKDQKNTLEAIHAIIYENTTLSDEEVLEDVAKVFMNNSYIYLEKCVKDILESK